MTMGATPRRLAVLDRGSGAKGTGAQRSASNNRPRCRGSRGGGAARGSASISTARELLYRQCSAIGSLGRKATQCCSLHERGWRFIEPVEGMTLYVKPDDR